MHLMVFHLEEQFGRSFGVCPEAFKMRIDRAYSGGDCWSVEHRDLFSSRELSLLNVVCAEMEMRWRSPRLSGVSFDRHCADDYSKSNRFPW